MNAEEAVYRINLNKAHINAVWTGGAMESADCYRHDITCTDILYPTKIKLRKSKQSTKI